MRGDQGDISRRNTVDEREFDRDGALAVDVVRRLGNTAADVGVKGVRAGAVISVSGNLDGGGTTTLVDDIYDVGAVGGGGGHRHGDKGKSGKFGRGHFSSFVSEEVSLSMEKCD